MRLYLFGLLVSVAFSVWLWTTSSRVPQGPIRRGPALAQQPTVHACLCLDALNRETPHNEKPSWACKQAWYAKEGNSVSEADVAFDGCIHFYDEEACERLQTLASAWCGQAFEGRTAFESPGLSGIKCLATAGLYLGDSGGAFPTSESYVWQGITLLAEACQNNLVEACWQLGDLQENGNPWVPPQPVEALATYRQLCALDSTACIQAARMIEQGKGVESNKSEALSQYESLCEIQNPTAACYYAATLYAQGMGSPGKREQMDKILQGACYEHESPEVRRYACRYVAEQALPPTTQ